jgi:hypothetical protein
MADTSELAQAQLKLDATNARIAAHRLNSTAMTDARAVVKEHRDEGKDAVVQALSERALPTAAQQGKALVLGLPSLARLNRKRLKLEDLVSRLTPPA